MSASVEWDPVKAEINLRKHGVKFSDAAIVLQDELAVTVEDLHLVGEERYVTIGADLSGRLFVVVFAPRGDRIRIISARRATRRERLQYQEAP